MFWDFVAAAAVVLFVTLRVLLLVAIVALVCTVVKGLTRATETARLTQPEKPV